MTDRELLELAAKAVGKIFHSGHIASTEAFFDSVEWDPLFDDGDALRLAIDANIELEQVKFGGRAIIRDEDDCGEHFDEISDDRYAATRRAITRAAAEIGKAMP